MRALLNASAIALSAVIVAGCGGDDGDDTAASATAPTTGGEPAATYDLPDQMESSGTFRLGVVLTTLGKSHKGPDGEITGLDVTFCKEMANRFGLEAEYTDLDVNGVIGAISAGRQDMICPTYTITEERRAEVNMVPQSKITYSIAVPPDSSVAAPDDLCGQMVSTTLGGNAHEKAEEWSDDCVENGKDPFDIQSYQSIADSFSAVVQERAAGVVQTAPVVQYYIDTAEGELELGYAAPVGDLTQGHIIAKDNTKLADAVQKVYEDMLEDGTYERILKEWNAPDDVALTSFDYR